MKIGEVISPGSDDAFSVNAQGEGKISDLPEHHRRLLDDPHPAVMATINASGTIQLSPIWLMHDGENLLVNSARGRLKDRNLRARPQVSLCVVDPDNQYHYISIQGTVIEIVDEDHPEEGHRATSSIDAMAKAYMDADVYPLRAPSGEVRSLFVVRPDRLSTFN